MTEALSPLGATPTTPGLDLKGMLPEQLRELALQMGEPAYRGDQLFSWIQGKDRTGLQEMTNLPRHFREALIAAGARVDRLQLVERRESATGMAAKFLFACADGGQIEAVLIRDGQRRTACLSSQIGCPLDCQFCATGRMGFQRNLTAAQIVDQLQQIQAAAAARGERVTNIVMMGMGEPLLNYEEVARALRLIRRAEGPAVGGRRITVSTAGFVPGIQRLAEDDLNVGLAISLNATTDEVRSQLMPINRKWPIARLLEAARLYFDLKGRRVTFEYVLMAGVTDSEGDALRLANLTRDVPCKINLIPYNELGEDLDGRGGAPSFRRPERGRIDGFAQVLRSRSRHTVTLRESRGQDIDAACGQLHREVGVRRRRVEAV